MVPFDVVTGGNRMLSTNGPGSGYVSIRNMAAELPLMLDVLTDDWENDFFEKKVDDNFMFSCCSIHIFKVKSKSNNPWIF